MELTTWDAVLIAAVTAQVTLIAYLHTPRWKALVYGMPVPFTFATLALGQPVGAANVVGWVLLLGYMHGVRVMHYRLKWPIWLAIAVSVGGYVLASWGLVAILPDGPVAFWVCLVAAMAIGAWTWKITPDHVEPGSRTSLPLPLKVPAIMVVLLALLLLKSGLQGFMTTFPMVGVVGAYEARRCLWAMCRQMPVILLTLSPMMALIYVTQTRLGLPLALALGWVVVLVLIGLMTRAGLARERRVAAELAAALAAEAAEAESRRATAPATTLPDIT